MSFSHTLDRVHLGEKESQERGKGWSASISPISGKKKCSAAMRKERGKGGKRLIVYSHFFGFFFRVSRGGSEGLRRTAKKESRYCFLLVSKDQCAFKEKGRLKKTGLQGGGEKKEKTGRHLVHHLRLPHVWGRSHKAETGVPEGGRRGGKGERKENPCLMLPPPLPPWAIRREGGGKIREGTFVIEEKEKRGEDQATPSCISRPEKKKKKGRRSKHAERGGEKRVWDAEPGYLYPWN